MGEGGEHGFLQGVLLSARRRNLLIAAVLALATLATFWPVLRSQFVSFDDALYVTQNPHVLGGVTWANVRWAFGTGFFGNWHPLTWLSHMLDVQSFGLNPAAHHFINLLWHIANTVFLFWLLRRLTGAPWRSAAVAALFAWHPLHVESVAWISERKDVLSTFFFLLTLWAYTLYVRSQQCRTPVTFNPVSFHPPGSPAADSRNADPRISDCPCAGRPLFWYTLACFSFALGLMSKAMLVTLPFVLLLLDYWPLARVEGKLRVAPAGTLVRLVAEKIPFFALTAAASVVAYVVQDQARAFSLTLPLMARLSNAVASYTKYLAKMFWPSDLTVYYPHPDIRYPVSHQWPAWALALAAVTLAAMSLAALLYRKQLPWLVTGWFWFLGTLVPVIGLLQAGTHGMADRYTYIPLIGVFICLVWTAAELAAKTVSGRRGLAVTTAVGLSACAVAATQQAQYWHDSETLFRHALAVNSDNAPAHFKLGSLEGARGNFAAALEHFRAAIRADPNYISAYYSLGMTLDGLGKPAEAVEAYQAVLRINPTWDAAHNRLGMALSSLGQYEDACREYAEALRLNPDSADAHFNFGAALLQLGRPSEAVGQFAQAARLSPVDPGALAGLGRALAAAGKPADALVAYERALSLKPDSLSALRGLAWLRATCADAKFRDGAEAVRLAQRATQGGSPDARALAAVDAAYAEAGRFEEAITAVQKTRLAAIAAGESAVARAAEFRLELYRQGRAFHEAAPGIAAPVDSMHSHEPPG